MRRDAFQMRSTLALHERTETMSKLAIFAAFAGLLIVGATSASAAPVSPPPATQITGSGSEITNVQWGGRNCWRDRWGRVQCRPAGPGWRPHPRHCWRDRWGRVVCR